MIITKNGKGNIVGWRETYVSDREIVNVSVIGNISTISTRDKKTGKIDSKTFFGKPALSSASEGSK